MVMKIAKMRDTALKLCCTKPVVHKKGRTTMSLSSHLQELQNKHQTLTEQVEAAQRSPSTDDLQINKLKKEKLRLKEEIGRLSHA